MSLLLDALKKAADDKQKSAQNGSSEPASKLPDTDESGPVGESADESADVTESLSLETAEQQFTLQPTDDVQDIPEHGEELTLDVLDTETDETIEKAASVDESQSDDVVELDAEINELPQGKVLNKPEKKSYTVSDEALSMLIQKTNRDVKNNRRIAIFSMLLLSLLVLTSGGVYYYMDMQAEIAALERKHQIALQSMRSKTNKENTPEQSKIIRNLVSDSGLDDKVQYAKKHMAEKKNTRHAEPGPVSTASQTGEFRAASSVSFQKTNKADPIETKLEEAWLAYENGEYGVAKKLYEEVLKVENNNRDAMLGMGAIAVIEKDHVLARDLYLSLLKLDPRDPIAIAAMASLQDGEVSLESEETFLLNMLQKNPDAQHLNFALGNVYARQEKWKFAQQSFFKAWQQDVKNADYIFNLAVTMDQLGKQKQAIDFYKDSLSKSKDKQVSFSRRAVEKRIAELSEL